MKEICQNVTNLPWPKSFFWCRWINRSTRQLQELQTNWQHFKSNALSWQKMSKIKCSMSKFDNANKKSTLFSTSMFSKLNYYGPAAACFYTGPLELLGADYPPQILADTLTLIQSEGGRLCPPWQYPPWIFRPTYGPVLHRWKRTRA